MDLRGSENLKNSLRAQTPSPSPTRLQPQVSHRPPTPIIINLPNQPLDLSMKGKNNYLNCNLTHFQLAGLTLLPQYSIYDQNHHIHQKLETSQQQQQYPQEIQQQHRHPQPISLLQENASSSSCNTSSASIIQATPDDRSEIISIMADRRPKQSSDDGNETVLSSDSQESCKKAKKSVLFDTVTVYHFSRSQGFISVPSQGGSTLGMKRKHFLRRKLSVDLYEEVRRRSRREILLKIRFDKDREKFDKNGDKNENSEDTNCSSTTSTSSSASNTTASESDEDSFSDNSEISDSELEGESYIFLQPLGVKLRRSLLKASGVGRIDPKEKRECNRIRDSRERSGCKCVNQCIPGLCECIRLGINCHVDRVSFPCGCISTGCRNPQGRTEFDMKTVKGHMFETLFKSGIG